MDVKQLYSFASPAFPGSSINVYEGIDNIMEKVDTAVSKALLASLKEPMKEEIILTNIKEL